nr:dihydroorotase [Parasporobacterium sp.]
MKLIIKNGRYINPATGADDILDVYVEDGLVKEVAKNIEKETDEIEDATGCIVIPGLIDLHTHLREPGFEHKETIISGCEAAAAGGYTTICAMPNTKPACDSVDTVKYILDKAADAKVNVLPIGAVTKGQQGKELADIKGMKEAGICAISEDGKSVMDTALYKEAMEIAAKENLPVFAHCEEITMVKGCVVNAGKLADALGVGGVSNDVEDVIATRDIGLSLMTGARLHLCHCSTKESVNYIKEGKAQGAYLTAEICPHHFVLTEDMVDLNDSNYKMNPPVRTKADVEALKNGIKEGIIDAISTDHAPHAKDEKDKGFLNAPCGIVGLETAFALSYTYLVKEGYIDLKRLVEMMSCNPAK